MKNLKLIFAIVAVTSLGLLAPSHAIGPSAEKAIGKLKAFEAKLHPYLETKNFDDIKDTKVKTAVKTACKLCGARSCKKAPVKTGCMKFCPHDGLKKCIAVKAK